MLTSKQRAYLRAMANSIETILMVGKGGISDDIVKQANDALKARELIKGKDVYKRQVESNVVGLIADSISDYQTKENS